MTKKHSIIIGLDALMPDCVLNSNTPNIDWLASIGAFSWDAQTEIECLSGPCWGALVTGVHTEKHGVFDNHKDAFLSRNFQYQSISRILTDSQIRCIVHANWKPIITLFEPGTLINSSSGPDNDMTENMCHDIINDKAEFYFIALNDVDEAGHDHGYGSPKYLDAIEKIDGYVGKLLDAIDSRPDNESWLICLVSDHGGWGNLHGRVLPVTPQENKITFIMTGAGYKGELIDVNILDALPTITNFFGVAPQVEWEGKIL